MKAFIAAACLTASPAFAYDTMTSEICQNSWDALKDAVIPYREIFQAFTQTKVELAADGWCEVHDRQLGWDGAAQSSWRAKGVSGLGFRIETVDPLLNGQGLPDAMAVRLSDFEVGTRNYDASLRLRRMPEEGQLIVESYTLRHEDGSGIAASMIMDGAYFSSIGNMQTSLIGMRMSDLRAQVVVNQPLLDDLDVDLSDVNRVSVGSALRDVPRWNVSTDSRQAFLAMVADKEGTIDVEISSESGLGIMQAALPFLNMPDAHSDDDIATAVGVALSGVTIDVSWKSGEF
ncbi:hypothetical protein CLV80_103344 [Yoonia maritima]|uniref:Uncharacterized protein n=1 Tax=Yoonia maritima TaxID=1435347 RepID=A0A2T0W1Y0_9RHOB|nr:hypothetical protein [Yoonia maritima]PRY79012.1 hypothetical protein CLV80_103344 [Yoonia maritima]